MRAVTRIPAMRTRAESRMLSRVTVRRKTGYTAQDEGTGLEVPVWDKVYTALPFRLGGSVTATASRMSSRTREFGGVDVQLAARTGHMPAATDNLADGDYIEVTEGENAGTVLAIVEATWQDQATARRVPVIEAIRPTEWDA